MCGILGYILIDEKKDISKDVFMRGLGMMRHRGPDDEGYWVSDDRRCGLGHRRLSIIDLSDAGHQPMVSDDGNLVITYNGEIYNFRQVENELRVQNAELRMKSSSDTEVILKAYEKWGVECLDRFRGMFAFAIYDKEKRRLFFARDRMGIKPFYYVKNECGFFFSSEIRPLFEISGISKNVKNKSVTEYLAFGKVHSPNTMFDNVYKLDSANFGIVDVSDMGKANFEVEKYWNPYKDKMIFDEKGDDDYYSERLFEVFKESVNYRLISDVPVGVFLSGGVDSTGIVGMINHLGKSKDVYTYSAGFDGQDKADERKYAKKASEYYGTKHFEVLVKKEDLINSLPEILEHIDEPISDATIIPLYFLSKLARENGSIVILNGDGADELFAGYRKWQDYLKYYKYWKMLGRMPKPVKGLIPFISKFATNGNRNQILNDIISRSNIGTQLYIGDTGALKGTDLFDKIVDSENYEIFEEAYYEFDRLKKSDDYVEWMSYWGMKSMVENIFLYRADRMGMANSIEIRVPFLDHNLVEFGMQMPQILKYKNKTAKYLLKKSLERIVPAEYLYRKKMGFCVPVSEWAGNEIFSEISRNINKFNESVLNFSSKDLNLFLALIKKSNTEKVNNLSFDVYLLLKWFENWFQ